MKLTEYMNSFDPGAEATRIENFIERKQEKIGFQVGVIGLSGGIDSSLTTVLAKRALGQKIEVVFLPDATTPGRDARDVKSLAKEFQLDVKEIEIGDILSAMKDKLGTLSELTVANLKARARMSILYAIANENDGLVIGTGNLSEWLLGYFTKYGDGAADIAPLVHLYKAEVKVMARHLNIPESIISKPPSAGLWDGQTDEEELGGSYEDIDRILYLNHDLNYTPDRTKAELGVDPGFVEDVYAMVNNSTHKREEPAGISRNQVETQQ